MGLLDKFLAQVSLIGPVWAPFVLAWFSGVAIASYAIWKAMVWRYEGTISQLKDENGGLERTVQRLKAEPPPSFASSPNSEKEKIEPRQEQFPNEPPSPAQRVYLPETVTPFSIMELREGKTELQADKATELYLGKWMRLAGPISDVIPFDDQLVVGLDLPRENLTLTQRIATNVAMYFKGYNEKLEHLSPGDEIKAEGMIARIGSSGLTLIYCHLIG